MVIAPRERLIQSGRSGNVERGRFEKPSVKNAKNSRIQNEKRKKVIARLIEDKKARDIRFKNMQNFSKMEYNDLYTSYSKYLDRKGINEQEKLRLLGNMTRLYKNNPSRTAELLFKMIKTNTVIDLNLAQQNPGAKIYRGPQDDVGPRQKVIIPSATGKGQIFEKGTSLRSSTREPGSYAKGFEEERRLRNVDPRSYAKLQEDIRAEEQLRRQNEPKGQLEKVEQERKNKDYLGNPVDRSQSLVKSEPRDLVPRRDGALVKQSTRKPGSYVKEYETERQLREEERLRREQRAQERSPKEKPIERLGIAYDEKIREATEELIDQGLTEEGKNNLGEVEEVLRFILEKLENPVNQDLKSIIERLDYLKKYFEEGEFETFLKRIMSESYAAERPKLIEELVKKLGEEFPGLKELKNQLEEIDAVLNGLAGEYKTQSEEIKQKLLEILNKVNSGAIPVDTAKIVEELKKYFNDKEYKDLMESIFKPIVEKAVSEGVDEVIKRLEKIGILKDILDKTKAIDDALNNLKTEYEADRDEIKKQLKDILDSQTRTEADIKRLADELKALREYFDGDPFKDMIAQKIQEAIDAKAPEIAQKIIDELDKKGLLTKTDADAMKKEIITKVQEIIDKGAIPKALQDKLEKFMKDAEAKQKETDDKLKKIGEDAEKAAKGKKEAEAKPKTDWSGFKKFSGYSGLLILIGLILFALFKAANDSGSSRLVQITPVIGTTAKTVAGTSSIFGALGGINPLIIVLILVALFLLFPKK